MALRIAGGRGRSGWRRNLAAALLGAGALLLAAGHAPAQPPAGSNPLDDFEREILSLARRSEPFVVNIVAQLGLPPPPAAERPGGLALTPWREGTQRRIGTGIAIDDRGSIVTTASVVDGAGAITIRTSSGVSVAASIVGLDRRTNVALLSAPGAPVTAALRGESSLVPPGSRVLVVGSVPYRQPMSSFGTIQVDRGLVLGYSEVEMLQMNAPVLRGNSGAAVINSEGRVVGMVSGTLDDSAPRLRPAAGGGLCGFIYGDRIIATPGRDATFAIPIEKALEIAAELKEHGRVDRGFLGVVIQRGEGMGAGRQGVLVREVMAGSPAALAGLRAGDLITRYAGQDVVVGDQLTFLVSATRPGSRVGMELVRNGRLHPVEVSLGPAPNLYPSASGLPAAAPGILPGSLFPPVPGSSAPQTFAPGSVVDSNGPRRP